MTNGRVDILAKRTRFHAKGHVNNESRSEQQAEDDSYTGLPLACVELYRIN